MNLLLVFADQMRGQAMGCAGNARVHTPNLDRLAGEGVRLGRAYANSPVCTPARGTILTGCYPLRHGAFANDVPIRTDLPSLGSVFRQAGCATGYVGKWHLDGVPRDKFTPPGRQRLGFRDAWAVHNCTHDYFHSFYYAGSPDPIAVAGYEPAAQTALAEAFIERNRHRPWCLVVSWGPPHNPYDQAPPEHLRRYDPAGIELRPNVPADHADAARRELAGYYAHITALDEMLGRLLARLDACGLAEQTLVVFTSDHGDMLHSQGRTRKQQPWEESILVPMIFRRPGQVPEGAVRGGLIGLVDLMPTILGLAGLPQPPGMQGRNRSGLVLNGSGGSDAILLMDLCPCDEGISRGIREWRGLRTERYTYARTIEGPWVLYDNDEDPYQFDNLADETSAGELRDSLQRRLAGRLEQAGDGFEPWADLVRRLGAVDLWNARERHMHGDDGGRLLQP